MENDKSKKKFAAWYEKNKDGRNDRRRDKYKKDKAFRESEKARVQAHREQNPNEGPRVTYRELNGKDVIVLRIGAAAEMAGTTPEIIRRYEAEGLIPIPTWDDEPQRLYTHAQCALIKKLADHRRITRAPSYNPQVVKMVNSIFEKWNSK